MHTSQYNLLFIIFPLPMPWYRDERKKLLLIALCCTIVFIHNGMCYIPSEKSDLNVCFVIPKAYLPLKGKREGEKKISTTWCFKFNTMWTVFCLVFYLLSLPQEFLSLSVLQCFLQYLSLICTQMKEKVSRVNEKILFLGSGWVKRSRKLCWESFFFYVLNHVER